jgi:drug/metabolite transporter (DMT)-like permease
MDTRFDSLITPMLIRFLYVVSMILLTIGVIVVVIASFADKASSGVLALILAPLVALIYLIVVRLWLELIVVTFKIREAAEQVADNTRRPGV